MKEINRNSGPVSIELSMTHPIGTRTGSMILIILIFTSERGRNSEEEALKRKLISWCFILLIIAASVFVLYVLLRVKRVDVRVQAILSGALKVQRLIQVRTIPKMD